LEITETIRLLVADDQPECIAALELAVKGKKGIEVCGTATNGTELIIKTGRLMPDVVITDISMPFTDGIEATVAIKEIHPKVKVIALTQFKSETVLVSMMQSGADAFLVKDVSSKTLELAIHSVIEEKPFFCETTNKNLLLLLQQGKLGNKTKDLPPDYFAPNEKEILLLVCEAKTNNEIATELRLSYNTVIKYRQRLMEKTGTKKTAHLVLFAVEHGLFNPAE
jgi:DNA-binding NarL/FixJ family response regulator